MRARVGKGFDLQNVSCINCGQETSYFSIRTLNMTINGAEVKDIDWDQPYAWSLPSLLKVEI